LTENVIKYHRTVATYVNELLAAGFTLTKLAEPKPTPGMMENNPAMKDEARRPMFLIMAAVK
jgi:hypothetical protein